MSAPVSHGVSHEIASVELALDEGIHNYVLAISGIWSMGLRRVGISHHYFRLFSISRASPKSSIRHEPPGAVDLLSLIWPCRGCSGAILIVASLTLLCTDGSE